MSTDSTTTSGEQVRAYAHGVLLSLLALIALRGVFALLPSFELNQRVAAALVLALLVIAFISAMLLVRRLVDRELYESRILLVCLILSFALAVDYDSRFDVVKDGIQVVFKHLVNTSALFYIIALLFFISAARRLHFDTRVARKIEYGRFNDVIELCKKELSKATPPPPLFRQIYIINQTISHCYLGEFDAAGVVLDKLELKDVLPNLKFYYHSVLSTIYAERDGSASKAEEQLNAIQVPKPYQGYIFLRKSFLADLAGDTARADELFAEYLKRAKKRYLNIYFFLYTLRTKSYIVEQELYFLLGSRLLKRSQFEEAKELLTKVVNCRYQTNYSTRAKTMLEGLP